MVKAAMMAAIGLATGGVALAAPVVAPPAATVQGHSVVHRPSGMSVRVPGTATFVGTERFDLKGVADAEIEVFAEADRHKRLTRLYWIQFEHPWPGQTWRYDYTGDRRDRRWGTAVWVRDIPYRTSDTPEPRGDVAHVRAMLKRAGYTLPPQMTLVRMIQLLDDPKGTGRGGKEVMFIYAEDAARPNATLDQRALAAFQVTRR